MIIETYDDFKREMNRLCDKCAYSDYNNELKKASKEIEKLGNEYPEWDVKYIEELKKTIDSNSSFLKGMRKN